MTRIPALRAVLAGALISLAASPLTAPNLALADEPGGVGVPPPPPVTGEQVYQQVCQACHMADARGGVGAGAIPALAANPRMAVAAYPITIVARGKGAMPGLTDTLSPAQIAAVIGYVRTHFGNAYDKPVTEAEVVRLSPSHVAAAQH